MCICRVSLVVYTRNLKPETHLRISSVARVSGRGCPDGARGPGDEVQNATTMEDGRWFRSSRSWSSLTRYLGIDFGFVLPLLFNVGLKTSWPQTGNPKTNLCYNGHLKKAGHLLAQNKL